jgi:cysteine desulfurase
MNNYTHIYLDHAASTPLYPSALERLQFSFQNHYASSEAIHPLGHHIHEALEKNRQSLLHYFHFSHDWGEAIFTSSASEGNNFIIKSFLENPLITNGQEQHQWFYFSKSEHPSLTFPFKIYPHNKHIRPLLHNEKGELDLGLLELEWEKFPPSFVGICHLNNSSGHINPIDKIQQLIQKINPKCFLLVDMAQSFGKFPEDSFLSWAKNVDAITLAAHKSGGPKGVAATLINKKKKHLLRPFIHGGDQEHRWRASTVAYPLIESWMQALQEKSWKHFQVIQSLRDFTEKEFLAIHPSFESPFSHLSNEIEKRSPYILLFSTGTIPSDVLIRLLGEKKIYVSSSSACTSKKQGPNEIFSTLGLETKKHKHMMRVSFSPYTTQKEVEIFIHELKKITADLLSLKSK